MNRERTRGVFWGGAQMGSQNLYAGPQPQEPVPVLRVPRPACG